MRSSLFDGIAERLRPLGAAALVRQRPPLARSAGRPARGRSRVGGRRRRHRHRRRGHGDRLAARQPRDRHRPERGHARARPRAGARGRPGRADRAAPGRGRVAAAGGRLGGRAGAHLPAALRGRPGGGAARAGAADPARRPDGVARVLRTRRRLVSGLVGVDADRAAGRRPGGRRRLVSAPAASWARPSSSSGATTRSSRCWAGGPTPASPTCACSGCRWAELSSFAAPEPGPDPKEPRCPPSISPPTRSSPPPTAAGSS